MTASVESSVILGPNQFVTGVRGWSGSDVVLTGSNATSDGTSALLYLGPLTPTDAGALRTMLPVFDGQDVTGATFYGPDTWLFTPSLGQGNLRAVGSYQVSGSSAYNHGMIYEGAPDGSGSWTQIDVPEDLAGGPVWNTIAHSTMGGLVVGNYDIKGKPASANAFVYDIDDASWTLFDLEGCALTTAYGIWRNDDGSFTIVGGTHDGHGINRGMVIGYDRASRSFANMRLYSALHHPALLTHFEGITAVPGGFNLAGMTLSAAMLAHIRRRPDGSYTDAAWTSYVYDGASVVTGNTIYQNALMGIFAEKGVAGIQSYCAQFAR